MIFFNYLSMMQLNDIVQPLIDDAVKTIPVKLWVEKLDNKE